MTYRKFYSGRLAEHILEDIDAEYKRKINILIEEINRESWTEKQKKIQKSRIISNIALYKCFMDKGFSKSEAKELVKEHSFHIADKRHKLLKTFFHIPCFFRVFRFFMKKGMLGDEIWKSRVLLDDDRYYCVDVLKCLWVETCEFFECPDLCEVFCLCDHIVFGGIKGFIFKRSQTLGMNGQKCDFCFINEKGKNQKNESEKI